MTRKAADEMCRKLLANKGEVLADLLPDAEATTTPAQLMAELTRQVFQFSEATLTQALALLQSKDILTHSGPQSSLYRFKIDLIRRWVGITRPAI